MTIFTGPNREAGSYYMSKFVRIGPQVYVTKPNDTETLHSGLAQADGVHDEVLRALHGNRDEIDAGQIAVRNDPDGGGRIRVTMHSTGFQVPLPDSLARVITGEVMGRLSPGYDIKIDIPKGRGRERG